MTRGAPREAAAARAGLEFDLLRACARTVLDPAATERLLALTNGPIRWPYLADLASRHGLVPLLHRHIADFPAPPAPEAFREDLDARVQEIARRNLSATRELIEIVRRLEARGIPAIPFKGPLLALSVYGNLALREFADLDILARQSDVRAASQVLVEMGYRPECGLSELDEANHFSTECEIDFFSTEDPERQVEIHWALGRRYHCLPVDLQGLWERARTVSLGGTRVPDLAPEDLLLVLAAHGTKHCWERLGWICDVAELLRAREGLDWSTIFRSARASGGGRALLLGLVLAANLLGAPLPRRVESAARADPTVSRVATRIRRRLASGCAPSPGLLGRFRDHLEILGPTRDRLRYILGILFAPRPADRAALPLPSRLRFLYPALRPALLAARHLPRLANRRCNRPVGEELPEVAKAERNA